MKNILEIISSIYENVKKIKVLPCVYSNKYNKIQLYFLSFSQYNYALLKECLCIPIMLSITLNRF